LFRSYFLNYKNPFGPNTRFKKVIGNFDPFYISFIIPRKNKLNLRLGLSLLGVQNTNFRFFDRIYQKDYSFPNLEQKKGDYEGLYNYRLRSSEYWFNLSISRVLSKRFSMGMTFILGYRYLDYVYDLSSNYVFKNELNVTNTASFHEYTETYMYNIKFIYKLGFIYNINENSRIGINLTSSSLNLFGRGSNYHSISEVNVIGLLIDSIGFSYNDQLTSAYNDNLKANHKSPLNVSIGYNIEFRKQQFGVVLAFFNRVEDYKVVTGVNDGDFINTAIVKTDEANFLNLYYGQRYIINFAIGYQRTLNESFTILTGFRTNFSTSVNKNNVSIYNYNYLQDLVTNYYHLTVGNTFTLLKNKFIFGIDFGFNFLSKQPNIVNYTTPLIINNQGYPLRGDVENNANTTNYMLGVVIGYSLKF
jgi:hypothetical protein